MRLDLFCYIQGPGTAQIGEGGDNSWTVIDDDDDDEEMEENDEIEITDVRKRTPDPVEQSSQQKNRNQGNAPFPNSFSSA